jgi:23S rRNA pseudouridine1911/1915/1917 synthase
MADLGDREPWRTLVVETDVPPGRRLDAWLAERLPGTGRRAAARSIEAGRVTLDGRPARKGDAVRPGQLAEVLDPPRPERWTALPDPDDPLTVLLADPDFVAVDKPAGLPSTPRSPDEPKTLAGRVAARFPECAVLGRSSGDAGLLQRLDRGTSGAVLVARTEAAFAALSRLQGDGRIEKAYLALVREPAAALPGKIDAPLGPAGPRGGLSRAAADGRPASTALEVVEARGGFLLVRAVIHRGARHQIRAHLGALGAPIAGDTGYGGPEVPGLSRPFLHASRLAFPHPRTGEPVEIDSPLPEELSAVLAALGFGDSGLPRNRSLRRSAPPSPLPPSLRGKGEIRFAPGPPSSQEGGSGG